jgi:hypothetical protein
MQVELLRDLINMALAEPNQKTRIGTFWCFAQDYDDEVPLIKALFLAILRYLLSLMSLFS